MQSLVKLVPIWIWYEYSAEPARYIQLNIQAILRHAPSSHFVVHFVNRSNIASFVPNLPDEFWRLGKHVAFSDAGRLALLATNGGLYLDVDFLVMRSLVPVANLLQTYEIIGYPFSPAHGEADSAAKCASTGYLSANFIAVRLTTNRGRERDSAQRYPRLMRHVSMYMSARCGSCDLASPVPMLARAHTGASKHITVQTIVG